MDRTNAISAAGTMSKKACLQQIPTGRTPTCPVQPLLQCSIPAPRTPIPGTETHGRPGCPRNMPPRKIRRNRKHAGDPTTKKSNASKIRTIFLHVDMMLITRAMHAQLPILTIICPTSHVTRHNVFQPGSRHGITSQITYRWNRCWHGMDSRK